MAIDMVGKPVVSTRGQRMVWIFFLLSMPLLILPSSDFVLIVINVLATTVAGIICLRWMKRGEMYVGELMAVGLVAFYCGGLLLTVLLSATAEIDLLGTTSGQQLRAIQFAVHLVLISTALLLWCTRWEKVPVFSRAATFRLYPWPLAILGLVGSTFVVLSFLRGALGFGGGTGVVELTEGRLPWDTSIAWTLAPALPAVFAVLSTRASSRIGGALWILLGIALLVLVIPLGRRMMIISGLTFLLPLVWNRQSSKRVTGVAGSALVAVAIITLLGGGSLLYHAARDDLASARVGQSLLDALLSAQSYFTLGEAARLLAENITADYRLFGIAPFADLIVASDAIQPLFGGVIISNILVAIPRIFFPQKAEVIYPSEEDYILPHFGLPFIDVANTLPYSGYADFFYLGSLLLCVLGWLLTYLLFVILSRFLRLEIMVIVGIVLVRIALIAETTFGSMLAGLRETAILAIGCLVVLRILELVSSSKGRVRNTTPVV